MLADGKWGNFSAIGNIPSAETRPTPRPAITRPAAGIKQKLAYALEKEREKPRAGKREIGAKNKDIQVSGKKYPNTGVILVQVTRKV